MLPRPSRLTNWVAPAVAMLGGMLCAVLPVVYAVALARSLESQHSEYRVPIRSAVVAQGMITDRQVKSAT